MRATKTGLWETDAGMPEAAIWQVEDVVRPEELPEKDPGGSECSVQAMKGPVPCPQEEHPDEG